MGLLNGVLSVARGVGSIIDKLHTSDGEKMQLKIEFQKLLNAINLVQAQINLADAQSRRAFQANWRPFIGWTCGVGLAFNIFYPIIEYFMPGLPKPDNQLLYPTITGLLGIAGMRTFEKYKGVAK